MPLQVLSPTRHRQQRWTQATRYTYAAERNLVGLAAGELSRAALTLPLAFVGNEGHWSLCAVLGFATGQNLYVGPDGQWIGNYVPAALRTHPFHLGWEGGSATLCVDEDSDLLPDDGTGEPIFDEGNDLSPRVREVWAFLSQIAQGVLAMEKAAHLLVDAGVIEPWPITIQGVDGAQTVSGLYRINEGALSALDETAFSRLRRAGVLGVAYAQLLSMGNLADLGKLAQARAEAEAAARAKAEVKPMIMLPDDSTIDWDWSKVGR